MIGKPLIHLPVTGSTMDDLVRLAVSGGAHGTVLTTEFQKHGRGRSRRSWQSASGRSILCSILVRPVVTASELGTLPLVTGLALAEAIEAHSGVHARLRWPNDLVTARGKLGGVLMQAQITGERVNWVVIGFGVNVASTPAELPSKATSLWIETGQPADRRLMLRAMLNRIDSQIEAWQAGDWHALRARWLQRSLYLGEWVQVTDAGEVWSGLFSGIAADGGLELTMPNGRLMVVRSGDLTRGPRPLAAV